jgi:hypothetical protein
VQKIELQNSFGINLQLADEGDGFSGLLGDIRDDITRRFLVDKNEELLLQAWSDDRQQWGELAPLLHVLCNEHRQVCNACGACTLPQKQSTPVIEVRICRAELSHLLQDDTRNSHFHNAQELHQEWSV